MAPNFNRAGVRRRMCALSAHFFGVMQNLEAFGSLRTTDLHSLRPILTEPNSQITACDWPIRLLHSNKRNPVNFLPLGMNDQILDGFAVHEIPLARLTRRCFLPAPVLVGPSSALIHPSIQLSRDDYLSSLKPGTWIAYLLRVTTVITVMLVLTVC